MADNSSLLTLTPALPPMPDQEPPMPPFPPNGEKNMPPPLPLGGMDDSGILISEQVFNILETILNVYVINIVSLIGSTGNVLSIIILSIHGFKQSTNILLVSMAVADLLFVLTIPLRKISLIIKYFSLPLSLTVESYIVRCGFLTLYRVWSLISNTHVAVISMERFIAVYFPFQVSRWVTVPRMIVVVLSIHVFWFVALFPQFAMFDLTWMFFPELNATIAMVSITPFYLKSEDTYNAYYSYAINITAGGILLLFTLICCCAIAIRIRSMGKERKLIRGNHTIRSVSRSTTDDTPRSRDVQHDNPETERRQKPEKTRAAKMNIDMKAVKMLMTVCILFLILIFPTFLLAFFQGIFPELRELKWYRVNFIASSLSQLLATINASVNFIVYIVLSSKFYTTFWGILCCCRARVKRNGPASKSTKDTPP